MNLCSGRQLGQYHLMEKIGSGGMGDVYRAEDVYLKKIVVMKVFEPSSEYRKEWSLQEMDAMLHLSHPNLIRIHEFGIYRDEEPYIVMEYANNGSLRDRHPKGTILPLAKVANYVQQAAQALQYLHESHIIHRDVKPENMLLMNDEKIVLCDFGISVPIKTPAETRGGTCAYMAPESFDGKPKHESDQYSLAVVAYELLCGSLPFFEDSPRVTWLEWAKAHKEEPVIPLSQRGIDISPALEEVVLRALAKQPEDRYVDVTTFAAALLSVVEEKQNSNSGSVPAEWYKEKVEEYEQALHVLSTHWRNQESSAPVQGSNAGDGIDPLLHCIVKPYMEQALARLFWLERSCLLLHIDAQFSVLEVAHILDITPQQVQVALKSGQKHLLQVYETLVHEKEPELACYKTQTADEDGMRVAWLIRQTAPASV